MDEVEVFFGNYKIMVNKDISFKDLRFEILQKEKRLRKLFSFGK